MLRPTATLSSMWAPLLLELLCYLNGPEGPLQGNNKQIHNQNSDAPVDGTKRALGKICYDISCAVLHNPRKYISSIE
jgi:hypothetical protein